MGNSWKNMEELGPLADVLWGCAGCATAWTQIVQLQLEPAELLCRWTKMVWGQPTTHQWHEERIHKLHNWHIAFRIFCWNPPFVYCDMYLVRTLLLRLCERFVRGVSIGIMSDTIRDTLWILCTLPEFFLLLASIFPQKCKWFNVRVCLKRW